MKAGKQQYSSRRSRSKVDEARDILANVVVCHIPVLQYDFQQKVRSLCSAISSLVATESQYIFNMWKVAT